MTTSLRIMHLLAVCLFIGSIPAHILLGQAAQSVLRAWSDPQQALLFATYHQAKLLLTQGLTLSALIATGVSGLALGLALAVGRGRSSAAAGFFRQPSWLWVKLGMVALVGLNGALFLTPWATEMTALATQAMESGQALPSRFQALQQWESLAGGINILLLTGILTLSVIKRATKELSSHKVHRRP